MNSFKRSTVIGMLGTALLLAGCAPKVPPVVPASGTVYLDGQPLPFVRVEFVPTLDHFGAETNSSAVTDENGHFTLLCAHQQQPGAVVARHKVLVIEHIPDEMRGMDARSQDRLSKYLTTLKNRPIPELYGSVGRTTLVVEVREGQAIYDLQLTR